MSSVRNVINDTCEKLLQTSRRDRKITLKKTHVKSKSIRCSFWSVRAITRPTRQAERIQNNTETHAGSPSIWQANAVYKDWLIPYSKQSMDCDEGQPASWGQIKTEMWRLLYERPRRCPPNGEASIYSASILPFKTAHLGQSSRGQFTPRHVYVLPPPRENGINGTTTVTSSQNIISNKEGDAASGRVSLSALWWSKPSGGFKEPLRGSGIFFMQIWKLRFIQIKGFENVAGERRPGAANTS